MLMQLTYGEAHEVVDERPTSTLPAGTAIRWGFWKTASALIQRINAPLLGRGIRIFRPFTTISIAASAKGVGGSWNSSRAR